MMPFAYSDTKASNRYGPILYFLIVGYIVSLFIKNAPVFSNGFMFLILLFACINTNPNKYLQQFSNQKINLGIVAFFLVELISVLLSTDKASGFDILSLRLPLLIIPLAFCLIEFEEKTWHNILLFYVLATVVASLTGFSYGAFLAIKENNSVFFYNDNISQLLLGKQAAYFGLYINVAILAIIYLISNVETKGWGFKLLLIVALIWLLFINYMLASKMSTISLILILSGLSFIQIIRKKKILEGLILVFALAISTVILANLFPETISRFKTITQTGFRFDNTNSENSLDDKFDANKWSSGSTRMALWTCGKEIFLKHPLIGTGLGDIRGELKKKYTEKNFLYALNTNKNLHCQYFDIGVSMGIVGLIIFLFTFFFYPIKKFIEKQQDFAISIFISVALCLLTENMFDRYQGEEIIAFILPLSAKIFNKKI
ncbi:MAG TPA: O-antigen ligase family protein [Bacteroidia bacterium]|nr:O-antigen ligase family protein [Bacteroidia bacterium]